MGQRRERHIGRPRSPRLPDPGDPNLRAWVIGLDLPAMHREVCAFLRTRGFLTLEALADWTYAGFPGWPAGQSEMPPSLRLRLAERLTITVPLVPLGSSIVPLLPFGALVNSPPLPAAPTTGSPDQLRTLAVLGAFQARLAAAWWEPRSPHAALVTEHKQLRAALVKLQPADRRLWRVLFPGPPGEAQHRIAGRSYPRPPKRIIRQNPRPAPSRAAAILMAGRLGLHAREVEARRARATREARIASAWSHYAEWLIRNPAARAQLDQLLPSMTRGATSPSAGLSSPPTRKHPAPAMLRTPQPT